MPPELLHCMLLLLTWQQNTKPAAEKIQLTPGQSLSLLLLLPLLGLSIVVGIKWLVALLNHRHPLPDAGRGLPRIPRLLTGAAVFVSLLQMLAVWSAAVAPADSIPPGTGTATTAETTVAGTTGADGAEEKSTADPATKAPAELDEKTRRQAWTVLIASLVMNLVICIPMAMVVIQSSGRGRVLVTRSAVAGHVPQPAVLTDAGWPDLDADPIGIPTHPVAVERTEPAMNSEAPQVSSPVPPPLPRVTAVPFSFLKEFLFAAEVMLAAWFPTMLLRFLLVVTMQAVTGEEAPSNPLLEMITSGAAGGLLAMIIFLGIIMAPLAEELQFRVVLLGGLLQSTSRWLALAVSSVTFSLLHGLPDGFALLPLAFALGYAFERRQSYVTVVIIHFLFNSLNLGVALLAGS
ncbi:MAG: lysostaphin resistance A-like protein [Planctomycetota bacterium]